MASLRLLPALLASLLLLAGAASGQSNQAGTWSILNARVGISPNGAPGANCSCVPRLLQSVPLPRNQGRRAIQGRQGGEPAGRCGPVCDLFPGGNFKSPVLNDEIRTWIQASLTNQMGRFKWNTATGWNNAGQPGLPQPLPVPPQCRGTLNKASLEPGTLYATIWDEIFLTNQAPHFERNRFFAGLGYEISPPSRCRPDGSTSSTTAWPLPR